ncbi:hypothetical protein QJQ45_019079 [Haematococcus lacustris]|nr:hypothetical protein QJQ45_019079 [Haematococcus lacustris]
MPPVPKHTRANRANGAKAQAHHEAAKSMEQLTAAHAALTAAHAAVTADLLSSQQLYSQLRERHISLMVFAGQRDQQWELDLLGYMQQVTQLKEAFVQELQGTQAQLTDTAAAQEAAQKGLAAARTELAHTKQQLTTTNSKLEQLRAQVAAANKGLSKDHKDKWNLLMRSRVSLPFSQPLRLAPPALPQLLRLAPSTMGGCQAKARCAHQQAHPGTKAAEQVLKQRDTRLQEWDVHQRQKQQQQQGGRRQAPSGQQFLPFDPAVFDPYATLEDFLDDIRELAAGQPCSLGLRTHLVEFFGAAPSSNHAVESSLQHTKHGNSAKQGLDAMIGSINNKLDPGALANIDLADFEARLLTLRKQKRDKETTSADDNREAKV